MFKSNKTKWIIFDIISMIGLKMNMDSFGIPQRSIDKIIGDLYNLIENLKTALFNFALSMEHPIINLFSDKLNPFSKFNEMIACFNQIQNSFQNSLKAKNVVLFAICDIGFGNLISLIAAFVAYICFIGCIFNLLIKGNKVETRARKCFRAMTFANIVQVAYIIIFDVAFIISNVDGIKHLRLNFPIFSLIVSVFGIIALKFSTFREFQTAVVKTVNKYTNNSSIPTVNAVKSVAEWKCPSCGKQNSENDPFCSVCGFSKNNTVSNPSSSNLWHCSKCGYNNSADSLFCTGCGESKENTNEIPSLPSLPDSSINNNITAENSSPVNSASETQNSPSPKTDNSDLEQIKRLKELLDMGAITQEEFEQKKKEILKLDK